MWLRRMASACNLKAKPLGSVRSDLTAWTVKRNKVWNLHYISKTVNLKSDDSSCDVMWCNLFSHTQVYLSHPLILRYSSFLLPNYLSAFDRLSKNEDIFANFYTRTLSIFFCQKSIFAPYQKRLGISRSIGRAAFPQVILSLEMLQEQPK